MMEEGEGGDNGFTEQHKDGGRKRGRSLDSGELRGLFMRKGKEGRRKASTRADAGDDGAAAAVGAGSDAAPPSGSGEGLCGGVVGGGGGGG
eukprot:CAMPEP_0114119864 /NCGR_PEP_ID=MMETSP0043_2-20121206/6338_1 /TAXON_ID=464988 /ORGANISM="Hemiselmis andersenii, Strain CCMP644" /LENGTH=90 /DNA_ID=CAMNT_0001212439 /DNA_START=239 /DNA_END=508 /DNA_ORIENTATION=-